MGTPQSTEFRRTDDAGTTHSSPAVADVDEVSSVRQPAETARSSVYFDTEQLHLARRGATLRRTSGLDAAWRLSLPGGAETHLEVRLPPSDDATPVPAKVIEPVRALVRDHPLVPIVRIFSRRPVPKGSAASHRQDSREWEVELMLGDKSRLEGVEERLHEAGATPALDEAQVAQVLVETATASPSGAHLARGSGAELLVDHLAAQIEQLQRHDRALRADEPGSVHQLRIAARRLRSALKTYHPLLDSPSADAIAEELRWLGRLLSRARDAQVLRDRLRSLLASEPEELVLGPVWQRIDDDLRTEYRRGREQAMEALDTERYFRLLDVLDDLVVSPPLTSEADQPAQELLPRLLARDARRLRRAVRETARPDHHPNHHHRERDDALHEVRKKAKRLRYNAESAVPVLGTRAQKLASSAKIIQEALGEHQDAVVARHRLREYGARTHLTGENGFTFGRLHALEHMRATQAERAFEKAWNKLPRRGSDWLRR